MLAPARDYAALRAGFAWDIPERYNIAADVCDRWALTKPDRPAIVELRGDGTRATLSYSDLHAASGRLAGALAARGVRPGDRVAVLLPQSALVVIAHLAAYRLGAVALPLAGLFGPEALRFRLADSGARAAITDAAGLAKLAPLRTGLPALDRVLCRGGSGCHEGAEDLDAAMAGAAPVETRDTGPDDPALMIYTSGTTGTAKGALHGHRVLLGHLPGWAMMHDFPDGSGLMWTPSDWAWAGGLLNVVLPSLRAGMPVMARPGWRFEPEGALALLAGERITHAFLPPTALRLLRGVPDPRRRYDLSALRSLASAGEPLGAETFAWARDALGLTVGEAYGQTECNLVLASCPRAGVARAGAAGRPVPGHTVAILRADGGVADDDEPGEICVRLPDPVLFLGYWGQPEATAARIRDGWWRTGDTARRDADGYVHFVGRDDDLITSAAYRIGPTEIEDVLARHPAVLLAAAVGKPDALRTEIVKAFVVLREGFAASPTLADGILAFGRAHLSAHEYPRELEFREALPMTTTGKIIRRQLRDGRA